MPSAAHHIGTVGTPQMSIGLSCCRSECIHRFSSWVESWQSVGWDRLGVRTMGRDRSFLVRQVHAAELPHESERVRLTPPFHDYPSFMRKKALR